MRKLLGCLGLLTLLPTGEAGAFASLPDNPVAIGNCTAKVKVSAARLRAGPSLVSRVVGIRVQDEPVFVTKVVGKWVQVTVSDRDTAYVAAYLLTFPYNEILEQWKRDTPPPTVGKKARVKWASVNFREYPSSHSSRLGRFIRGDEIAVLAPAGKGWSLVQSRDASGSGTCFGFIPDQALAPPEIPEPPGWIAPLARVHRMAGDSPDLSRESPSEHLARTAWSPQTFALEMRARKAPPGQMLALR